MSKALMSPSQFMSRGSRTPKRARKASSVPAFGPPELPLVNPATITPPGAVGRKGVGGVAAARAKLRDPKLVLRGAAREETACGECGTRLPAANRDSCVVAHASTLVQCPYGAPVVRRYARGLAGGETYIVAHPATPLPGKEGESPHTLTTVTAMR